MDHAKLLKGQFSEDPTGIEPMFTFWAKDTLCLGAIMTYRMALPHGSIEQREVDEWIKRAIQWREMHPQYCKMPTL